MGLGRWSLSLVLFLLAAACKDKGAQAPEPGAGGASGGGGAVFGAALSLTGAAASYGAQQRAGIQAAMDEVNGGGQTKVSVLFEDDASTKEQGITVFQKFINRDKVSAIIGPTLSNTASASDPLAQQAKVPVLGISNTAATGITDIGNYIWRDSLTEAQVIPGAFKKAQEKLHFKTAGVLYGNDDVFTKAGYDVMQKALQDLWREGARNPDLRQARPRLQRPAHRADGGEARRAGGLGARRQRFRNRRAGAPARMDRPDPRRKRVQQPGVHQERRPAADGVMVGTSWNSLSQDPANQKFLAAMKKAGVNPDQFSAQAYTGVIILAEAIKQSGGKTVREDIEAGLGKVKDLETPLGKFSFTPNRDAQHEPSVQQVKDGKFQIVQ